MEINHISFLDTEVKSISTNEKLDGKIFTEMEWKKESRENLEKKLNFVRLKLKLDFTVNVEQIDDIILINDKPAIVFKSRVITIPYTPKEIISQLEYLDEEDSYTMTSLSTFEDLDILCSKEFKKEKKKEHIDIKEMKKTEKNQNNNRQLILFNDGKVVLYVILGEKITILIDTYLNELRRLNLVYFPNLDLSHNVDNLMEHYDENSPLSSYMRRVRDKKEYVNILRLKEVIELNQKYNMEN